MKKLMVTTAAIALMASSAFAQDVKIGVLFGFTGPLESITPSMGKSAELAISEVNESKALLDGASVEAVRGDSTCVDAAAAVAAATRLVTVDNVAGIVGGDCSGVTGAVLQSVARPNGAVMISPSATSPALSTAPDDDLFFRTAPSDARQGVVMAKVLMDKGFKNVAVTFTDNDYGKGLANSFADAYVAAGGKITAVVPHQDGKADYSAEVASLASAGGDLLVVAGYVDQGGKGIIQASLDSGAFAKFFLPDGMYGDSLMEAIGDQLDAIGTLGGSESEGAKKFEEMVKAAGYEPQSYAAESYDAAALLMLAIQAAKSTKGSDYKAKVMDVANAPGEKIYPGELAKGLKLLAEGKEIDYDGASNVELIGAGDSAGSYRIYTIKDGKRETDHYE